MMGLTKSRGQEEHHQLRMNKLQKPNFFQYSTQIKIFHVCQQKPSIQVKIKEQLLDDPDFVGHI